MLLLHCALSFALLPFLQTGLLCAIFSCRLKRQFISFKHVCIYVCMWATAHVWRSEDKSKSWFSFYHDWVTETKLRSSDLVMCHLTSMLPVSTDALKSTTPENRLVYPTTPQHVLYPQLQSFIKSSCNFSKIQSQMFYPCSVMNTSFWTGPGHS